MKYLFLLLVVILIVQKSVAPPVTKDKKEEGEHEKEANLNLEVMEYQRYLQEVLEALESDPEFRAKLDKVDDSDIRNGKIANELEYVNHHVRTKLDELKRTELERLRHLAIKEYELENGLDSRHMKIAEHVDHTNLHTFEIDDLKKLILKTTKDLNEADRRRREEFKEYEMNKKFEQEEKMKNMQGEEKVKYENELHELEKKHKEHEPLHHPGSKKQLEEVWEKQDHMEDQEFNPRTFFFLHDLDGNGVWDEYELKALFRKELDKLYAEGHPEDDLVERAEEMERMREHVVREADLNKDGLISYEEFLIESKKKEFEQDPGWKPLDEQQIYSEQEYEEYKRQKAMEIERAIAKGMSQDYHAGQPQPGYQQFPPHANQAPYQDQMYHQPQYQQVPQQHYPQQGYQQQYPNQMPPQHVQYNQVNQQGQYQQVPSQQGQQLHPNQVPVSNNIHQVPVQQNYPAQNQQVPVQQNYPSQNQHQVPVAQHQVPPQQQQFQQQPAVPQNTNQNSQQLNPSAGQQQNQQQNQQPVANNLNQTPQQLQQNNPPVDTAHLSNQQLPVATGQNTQNTQNQVPQQTHEQMASMNNAQVHQAHQNAPNVAKP